ncbi:MAG: SDR family NAD(P)-dependent oxidoreductase [Thiomicrorhabdus sp.]|nr:SDR family NAD(P)-dependent oxidoreductase [Thiomicrorhabdus sp.]
MKTYLITGAAEGLGKALATQLVQLGHQVILLDKNLKALNVLYDELDSPLTSLYPLDLLGATLNDYETLQETLQQEFGVLDGVILNAAILPAFTQVDQIDYQQWYEILQTNLNANFHLIQNTLPLLKSAPKGAKLLAILDDSVKKHPAYYGAYGVAKAGLEQLMTTLAAEQTNSNIDVYTALLEPFATSNRGRLFPGENPMKLPMPDDIAQRILAQLLDNKPHKSIHCL